MCICLNNKEELTDHRMVKERKLNLVHVGRRGASEEGEGNKHLNMSIPSGCKLQQ